MNLIIHLLFLGLYLGVSVVVVGGALWFLVIRPTYGGALKAEVHGMTPMGPGQDGADLYGCPVCGRVVRCLADGAEVIAAGNEAALHPAGIPQPQGPGDAVQRVLGALRSL